jgi:hypothetical protein
MVFDRLHVDRVKIDRLQFDRAKRRMLVSQPAF